MSSLLFSEMRRELLQGLIAVSAAFPAMAFAKQSETIISLARAFLT
jgi:hypothetical protein